MGVAPDGDDGAVTGWSREVAQHKSGAGSSPAGQTWPSHVWPSDITAAGGSLVPGCWDGDTSGAASPGLGSAPPHLPAPALPGCPRAVGRRVRHTETWGWGVPPGGSRWDGDPGHPALHGSGDKHTQGHPHPSQAFCRAGSLGGWDPPRPMASAGSTKGTGEPPKSPKLPQRGGGEERQGKG